MRKTLPALVTTFEKIYENSGDAEAYGLSKLLCTYKFVASLYMLCDILHTVAKLHGSLQSKELDLATVPVMVSGTIKRLQELTEHPATSTWFEDHLKVFTETSQSSLQDVNVSEADKTSILSRIYRPYIQSVIDHISSRMESSDIFSAFSIFDPIHLPDSEESLSTYGMEKLRTLTDFYGKEQTLSFEGNAGVSKPDVDPDQAEAEWKIFHRILFMQHRSESGLQKIVTAVLASSALVAGFPNLASLARLAVVLPVTTATVERSFSDMKLIKTRLRSRLGEETLNHTMQISIEGPDKLNSEDLDSIIQYWKEKKTRKIMI